jgi:hypothetical protein
MSESIWWPDIPWWERKVLPLGFTTLSFRQSATDAITLLTAFLASLPFDFAIAGVSFGGRAAVFCTVFGMGYMISSHRVKLLPVELQALYFLRTKGVRKVRMKLNLLIRAEKHVTDLSCEIARPSVEQEMSVEDFKSPIPLTVSGMVKGIRKETRALLYLDDQVRGEDMLSAQKPRYRLTYVPLPEDVGKHHLSVRLEESPEPLVSVDLCVQGRSAELGESFTRVN